MSQAVSAQNDAQTPDAFLDVRDMYGQELRVELTASVLVIGRAHQTHLRLNSPDIAEYHAEVYNDPFGQWWVRDLDSPAGTWAGGFRVDQDHPLRDGETFRIADFELTFRENPDAEEAAVDASVALEPRAEDPAEGTWTTQVIPIGQQGPAGPSFDQHQAAKIDTIHLSTLAEFSQRLIETPDRNERLRMLCRLMVRTDFHGRASVALRLDKKNPQDKPQVLCKPQSSDGTGNRMPHISRSQLVAILRNESPILARLQTEDPTAPVVSAVACPLHNDDRYLDLIYVTLPAQFGTSEWLAMVSLAAQQYLQSEGAIAAARQAEQHAALEQELDSAHAIQMRLVPDDPNTDGLDVAIGFQPCRWVGGDYADVVPTPDGRIVLIVADVCGKGLPAALVTSTLHSMVHTLIKSGVALGAMMNTLNEHLCRFMEDSSFVTACALCLDPTTGVLECVNAGHPAPWIVSPDGSRRPMQHGANMPLGIVPKDLAGETDSLEEGSMLVLYSDGLSEMADRSGAMIGIEGLGVMMSEIYGQMATFAIDNIRTIVDEQLDKLADGQPPADDRTFVLARRTK